MGYLIRQYGVVNFYQHLLQNFSSSDSLTLLDNTIRDAAAAVPGTPTTLASALRHWHARWRCSAPRRPMAMAIRNA